MRILYVAQQYDYGQPDLGHGFEHYNFYLSLKTMGHAVTYFDYPTLTTELGKRGMNRRLLDLVEQEKPDLLFGIVRGDRIETKTIRRISRDTDTTTLNWFCDDHWQFDTHGRRWGSQFNAVVTTSSTALAKYQAMPDIRAIKSQWACNPKLYRPMDLPMHCDVSFVGQPYGRRGAMIEALERSGIKVAWWGKGAPLGRLSQSQMIHVFNQSRINLNFSDASCDRITRLKTVFRSHAVQRTKTMPGAWRVWDCMNRAVSAQHVNQQNVKRSTPTQIKGRVFEVPACGGFLLTQDASGLEDYYTPKKDLAVFGTTNDLIEKVYHYLKHEDQRIEMARAAHQRTIDEHTWAHRFQAIFNSLELPLAISPAIAA